MEFNALNELSFDELNKIYDNQNKLISLNGLKSKPFSKIIINGGSVVLNATDLEVTEDCAVSFYCDGCFTAQIDLESVVCIKSDVTDRVNIIVD